MSVNAVCSKAKNHELRSEKNVRRFKRGFRNLMEKTIKPFTSPETYYHRKIKYIYK